MNATKLRREYLQTDRQLLASDWTRTELYMALRQAREPEGGISLMEIAEVIQEALGEDAKLIKKDI